MGTILGTRDAAVSTAVPAVKGSHFMVTWVMMNYIIKDMPGSGE